MTYLGSSTIAAQRCVRRIVSSRGSSHRQNNSDQHHTNFHDLTLTDPKSCAVLRARSLSIHSAIYNCLMTVLFHIELYSLGR